MFCHALLMYLKPKVASHLRREKVSDDVLNSVASKLEVEGGLDVVEGQVIGEARRKVLANIENHKQEHKRWVGTWSIDNP